VILPLASDFRYYIISYDILQLSYYNTAIRTVDQNDLPDKHGDRHGAKKCVCPFYEFTLVFPEKEEKGRISARKGNKDPTRQTDRP
jgi:hypothetical protein